MTARVVAWPVAGVRVLVAPTATDARGAAALEREWARRCAENPRLHDGPVLAVESVDAARGEIVGRRSTYMRFVAGPALGAPITALGVSGVCVRRGSAGLEVLMGRRGAGVRIYAGMWETAPRGAVEPGAKGELGLGDLAACLAEEGREELGAGVRVEAWSVLALVKDAAAASVDVCLLCEVEDRGGAGSWEYADRRWTPLAELVAWARGARPAGAEGELSPPCAALVLWEGFSGCVRTRSSTP